MNDLSDEAFWQWDADINRLDLDQSFSEHALDGWREARRRAEALAQAVLLFHQCGPWEEAKRKAWFELTGSHEATTKVLCELARCQKSS